MGQMKWYILFFLLLSSLHLTAQKKISDARFFREDSLVIMELSTDLRYLVNTKKTDTYQPANVTLRFPDSTVISEPIRLTARGEYRRKNCFIPPMRLDFKNNTSPMLSPLKKLKLVCGCDTKSPDEKLLLKEFLVYKIYNLLTDMSFRVRLLHISYTDTRDKIKPFKQYGFLIEDMEEMAKRNKCREIENQVFRTERTDRDQMTLLAIFQYMIGNTDWSVPNYHNIKLMRPVTDSFSLPYTIPYDFDFCGIVNASYAVPHEELGIGSVQERLYRGFPRQMDEIQTTLGIFREKKEAIYNLVMNFEVLSIRYRNEMISYLDEFYKTIGNNNLVQRIFIDNARQN